MQSALNSNKSLYFISILKQNIFPEEKKKKKNLP